MTLEDTLQVFLKNQSVLGHTNKTIESYRLQLRPFINFMENRDIENINYNDYENYIVFLRSKKLESVSINSYARALKSFLHFCFENGFLKENIYKMIKLPRYQKKAIDILSSNEIDSVLSCNL